MLCLLFADHELDRRASARSRPSASRSRLLVMLTLLPALLVIVRPVDLLAAHPEARRRRADRARLLGARRRPHRAPPPRHVDRDVRDPRAWRASASSQLNATGLTTEESFRGTQPSIGGEKVLARALPRRRRHARSSSSRTPTRPAEVTAAFADVEGIDPTSITRARREGRPRVRRGHPDLGARQRRRLRHGRPGARRRARGARRGRAGRRHHRRQPRRAARLRGRQPADHPDRPAGRVPDPHGPAAAGGRRAAGAHRRPSCSRSGPRSASARWSSSTSSATPARTRRSRCSSSCSWSRSGSTTTSS